MPVTKQAIKKVRQDKRKTAQNLLTKKAYKEAIREFKKKPSAVKLSASYKMLDFAAKKKIIHKNTASRLKSRLAKLLPSPKVKKTASA